jgi:UDP-N-acetylglucosamine--N-acetylmuramyl-(pentapeptide) pyrophosphoryl-undecaprenol N-acetylglucosamine transferase
LAIPFKLTKGVAEAGKILKRLRPVVIFSKGGFVAYPVVRAAAKLGINVIAHESDMTMGLANKLSAKHCTTVCTTFLETAEANNKKTQSNKFVATGSPIRAELYNGDKDIVQVRHNTDLKKTNMLVTGGSIGAAKINEVIRAALPQLTREFNIIHLCGKGKLDDTVMRSSYTQLEFASDIENYFAWADIIVSRAGSNTICELMTLGKAVLFIPLSKMNSRGDQIENAEMLRNNNAAAVLSEDELTQEKLIAEIHQLYKNKAKLEQATKNLGSLDGTRRICEIITVK